MAQRSAGTVESTEEKLDFIMKKKLFFCCFYDILIFLLDLSFAHSPTAVSAAAAQLVEGKLLDLTFIFLRSTSTSS